MAVKKDESTGMMKRDASQTDRYFFHTYEEDWTTVISTTFR